MRARKMIVATFMTMAAVVGFASLAWACIGAVSATPYAQAAPNEAPAGAHVTVSGAQWSPNATVALRWRSATGDVLAAATTDGQGVFSKAVTIPATAPGSYGIVAAQGDVSDYVPFEVTASSAGSPAPGSPVSSEPAGETSQSASGATASAATPGPASSPQAPAAVEETRADPAATGASPPVATPTATAPSALAAAAPAAASPSPAPAGPEAAPVHSGDVRRLVRATSEDLWSGVVAGRGPSAPSLTSLAERPAGLPGGMELAIGGFALAVVAIFAGFGMAELSRRRVGAVGGARRSHGS